MENVSVKNDSVEPPLALYDDALPEVYGYLLRRTGSRVVAEDVAADTFFAALHSAQAGVVRQVTAGLADRDCSAPTRRPLAKGCSRQIEYSKRSRVKSAAS